MAGGPNRTKSGTIPVTKGTRRAEPVAEAKASAAAPTPRKVTRDEYQGAINDVQGASDRIRARHLEMSDKPGELEEAVATMGRKVDAMKALSLKRGDEVLERRARSAIHDAEGSAAKAAKTLEEGHWAKKRAARKAERVAERDARRQTRATRLENAKAFREKRQAATGEAEATYAAKGIAKNDKIWKNDSVVTRAEKRAEMLGAVPSTRPAAYALAFVLSTGRASTEFERAVATMPPKAFARAAVGIASTHGKRSVNDQVAAWKAAITAPSTSKKPQKAA